MNTNMFCFQCEQTANCKACTGIAGVCGKKANTAQALDTLLSSLINLAYHAQKNYAQTTIATDRLILEGLFSSITNVNFSDETIQKLTNRVNNEANRIAAFSNEESFAKFDMRKIWLAEEDERSLKSLILFGIKGMAAYAYHAFVIGYVDRNMNKLFIRALIAISRDDITQKELLELVMEVGEKNLDCMALLDRANTESFGHPTPTEVSLTIEKGPFIVISGHDLYDLKLLLQQAEGSGISVYTHGEMLPAHGYPELKKFKHLKGHFGTAWQNQQKEFCNIPAPVLFTTNCLMPPKECYADRIFTTEVVSYPGLIHIGEEKDFSPVIKKALELGGYNEEKHFTGINGGHTITTGFARNSVLANSGKVVESINSGAIKHIFLVGGCDGARPGRNYYTEFVAKTPKDSIILTLACGKYRFNDLKLGEINGLPRLMDMGQCNDAYSAIRVAQALADVYKCSINELPLSLVLSWYEQKAVAILLSLLYLGVKNIVLGPTLPAFVSKSVLELLVANYGISLITTPEQDLERLLK